MFTWRRSAAWFLTVVLSTFLLTLGANLATNQTPVFGQKVSTSAINQTPVFGPEKYIRETATPQKITKSFSIENPNEEFTLVVQNGEGKRGRVSSAVIELNGVRVVGPNEFNKQADVITKSVILQPQNKLAVEVRSQPGTSIKVTILGPEAPPPSPVSGITVEPDGFPVNTSTQVTFTAAVPYQPGGLVPTVKLEQISQDGNVTAVEGVMVDSGQLALGDEIQGDGVFSFRKTYNVLQPSDIRLRVKADVNGQLFSSDIFSLTAFTPISDNEANDINNTQLSAEQLYYQLLPTKGKDQALIDVVAFLKGLSIVQDAGISAGNIWIKYTNGMEGGISTNPPGTKGGSLQSATIQQSSAVSTNLVAQATPVSNAQVQSKKVLVLAPFLDEFKTADDGPAVQKIYEDYNAKSGCPLYDVLPLTNDEVGVKAFKVLGKYGIVHISSHGAVNNDRVVILTKTSNSTQNLQTYQTDLLKGRLTIESITGRTWLAVTPTFFTYYIKSMPSSLVFSSSCFSTFNDGIWNALKAKGAKAYLGFSDLVPTNFAYSKSTYFHKEWVEDPTTLITTGDVFNNGCSGAACWNLLGANNLEAPPGGLQDGGFESGALGAWSSQGDGRVVTQLGTFPPTEGKYAGLISTGLGFTVDSGSISQQACIPANASNLTFNWNFTSEEFREYCSSIYQDFFQVDLIGANGATTNLLSRKIDDLCAATSQVPFSFDQGDAWSTGWNSASVDISAFAAANAGKSVTLKFSAGDVGDSVYDSAVLLDNIKVNTP